MECTCCAAVHFGSMANGLVAPCHVASPILFGLTSCRRGGEVNKVARVRSKIKVLFFWGRPFPEFKFKFMELSLLLFLFLAQDFYDSFLSNDEYRKQRFHDLGRQKGMTPQMVRSCMEKNKASLFFLGDGSVLKFYKKSGRNEYVFKISISQAESFLKCTCFRPSRRFPWPLPSSM